MINDIIFNIYFGYLALNETVKGNSSEITSSTDGVPFWFVTRFDGLKWQEETIVYLNDYVNVI